MLNLPRHYGQRGVTLIELLIGLAIVAIFVTLAAPGFSAWIQNTQIRTAAESILNGMQLARAEAVRRNLSVQMAFDAGNNWTVSVVSTGEQIQARSQEEGSSLTAITFTPAVANTITYNGLGRVIANNDGSASITQVDVDSSSLSAAISRELRIVAGSGGNLRMCDPQVAAGDPRSCA